MASPIIDFLLTRNSPPIQELHDPAPSDAEIATILTAASRVPDHGRLEPWRFILYRGDARVEIGRKLAALAEQREGPLPEGRRNQELTRFSRAPLVIGIEPSSSLTACLMVREGAGVAIVDRSASLSGAFGDLAFRTLQPRIAIPIQLIYPRERPRSRASAQLAEALRQAVGALPS